jgi:hypothetical protein
VHFTSLKRENQGFPYLLLCIDVLSRFVFLEPVRNKTAAALKPAFEAIFSRSPHLPLRLYSDSGTEVSLCFFATFINVLFQFVSREMRKFFASKAIDKTEAHTHTVLHATLAERCIRTVREKLRRYFCEHNTGCWISVIAQIADNINNTVHTVTKRRPADVNHKNAEELWQELYAGERQTFQAPKVQASKSPFAQGATVRIAHDRLAFTKNRNRYSDEIYIVKKVCSERVPVVYLLEDLQHKPLRGYFYAAELCAVDLSKTEWRVERVLRTRTRNNICEHLVRWTGHSKVHDSWVSEQDLI